MTITTDEQEREYKKVLMVQRSEGKRIC